MKLHRLWLKDFRGITEREVVFPESGVIVVEGANEIGKSSMIEALDLLLEEKDSATKRAVREIRPTGLDVGTTVEAELSAGAYRFTYRKTWNRDQQTVLTVHRPVAEQLIGSQAHERVRQILAETTDERLFKALRLLQAQPVQAGGLAESSALSAALDAAAGTAGGVAAGGPLIEAVHEEYLRYFTPTGRLTGEQKTSAAAADTTREAVRLARAAVVEVTDNVRSHEELTAELAAYRTEQEAADSEFRRRRGRSDELVALRERHREAEQEAARLAAEAVRAADEVARRRQAADEVDARARDLERLTAVGQELQRLIEIDQGAADALAESVELAEAAAERADAVVQAASADVDHLQEVTELETLSARLAEIAAAAAEMLAAQRELAAHPLDGPRLTAIEQAAAEHDQALAAQRALAATVMVKAIAAQRFTVDGQPVPLAAGESLDRLATETVTLEIPGQFAIQVMPAADAAAVAERVRHSGALLTSALTAAQVTDLADARRAHQEHVAAVARARAARTTADRAGVAAEGGLSGRRDELSRLIADFLAARPSGSPLPADLGSARDAARKAREQATAARRAATRAREALRAQQAGDHRRQLELTAIRSEYTVRSAELDADRAALATARSVTADDTLAGTATVAAQRSEQARRDADLLAAQLRATDIDVALAATAVAERALTRLTDDARHAKEQLIGVQARLEAYGSQGRYDALDRALSDQQAADRRWSAVSARARAARMLQEVVVKHRDRARADYAGPFGQELNRLGRLVFGDTFNVEVDADLVVARRTLHGRTLDFQALSTGAKEQLAILARLAAAAVVAPGDGVPVFLDDALGFADPDRLQRIGSAFLAAPNTQLILLTCWPDRYRDIPGAQVIRLGGDAGRVQARESGPAAESAHRTRTSRPEQERRAATRSGRPPKASSSEPDGLFELGA